MAADGGFRAKVRCSGRDFAQLCSTGTAIYRASRIPSIVPPPPAAQNRLLPLVRPPAFVAKDKTSSATTACADKTRQCSTRSPPAPATTDSTAHQKFVSSPAPENTNKVRALRINLASTCTSPYAHMPSTPIGPLSFKIWQVLETQL